MANIENNNEYIDLVLKNGNLYITHLIFINTLYKKNILLWKKKTLKKTLDFSYDTGVEIYLRAKTYLKV